MRPCALGCVLGFGKGFGFSPLPHQLQDLHRGVVVVQDLALGGLADQFLVGRLDHRGRFADDVPLGRGRQRNAQVLLQPFQPIEGQPAAVLQQGDHAARRRVVLLRAHPLAAAAAVNTLPQRLQRSFCSS